MEYALSRTASAWKELKKDKKTVIAFRGGCGLFLSENRKEHHSMSGTNTSGWPFAEDTSGEGLDINAIFGGGAPASDLNPFDAPAEQTEETIEPAQTEEPAQRDWSYRH